MATEAQIVARGKSDYFIHKSVYNNPYPLESREFNDYERGWMQSLKMNNDSLVELPAQARSNQTPTPCYGKSLRPKEGT